MKLSYTVTSRENVLHIFRTAEGGCYSGEDSPETPCRKILIGGNVIEKKKESTVTIRMSAKDKDKIKFLAKRCGLSVSQYVKQRALGYEPRGLPPDVLFCLIEKIGALEQKTHLSKTDDEIRGLLSNITESLLLPQREVVS